MCVTSKDGQHPIRTLKAANAEAYITNVTLKKVYKCMLLKLVWLVEIR